MKSPLSEEIMSRYQAGEALSEQEQLELLRWLDSDVSRQQLFDDDAVNALLVSAAMTSQDATAFTEAILQRARRENDKKNEAATKQKSLLSLIWRFVPLAAAAMVLIVISIGLHRHFRNPTSDMPVVAVVPPTLPPASQSLGHTQPPREPPLATLLSATDAVWDVPHAVGEALRDDAPIKLLRGVAELKTQKGTLARLTAPVTFELRGPNQLHLQRGVLDAKVPPQAVGFTVTTPLSRVIDHGTEFNLTVNDDGSSATHVRRGSVSLRSQCGDQPDGDPIELVAGKLDRANISAPPLDSPHIPISTTASGASGEFFAMVSYGRETVEFHSPKVFEEFQNKMQSHLRQSPGQFNQHWSTIVQSVSKHGASGSVSVHITGIGLRNRQGSSNGSVMHARTAFFTENGRSVSIAEDSEMGIRIVITELIEGKAQHREIRATNPADLQRQDKTVFEMYQRHVGSGSGVGPTTSPINGTLDTLQQQLERRRKGLITH